MKNNVGEISRMNRSLSSFQEPSNSNKSISNSNSNPDTKSFFEKYLTVWVIGCICIGSVVGYYQPTVAEELSKAQFAEINAIVAVLLWVMIFPMLLQIDFQALSAIKKNPAAIGFTSVINYIIKPFTMYGLAVLFFRFFYVAIIPDRDLRDNYIAGLILLAGAPCTAMVLVWSSLNGGDAAYTLVQIAFNDLLLLIFYVPTAVLLIGVSDIELPWLTIIYAVILFIAAPLLIAATARHAVLAWCGEEFLNERIVKPFKPVTIVALLATLVLIFIFQGQRIGDKPVQIVLIAIPIIIQCVLNWAVCYYIGYKSCIPHNRLAPASMIATSNFFELAVAVAVSVYGLQSGAALATVVGVLVEVPVMLILTNACNQMKPWLDERCANCDRDCAWANSLEQATPNCCAKSSQEPDVINSSADRSVTIYHNPACETSCNVLKCLHDAGLQPNVVRYLEQGWTMDSLGGLLKAANMTPRAALRDTKSPAKELGLLDLSVEDDKLLEWMLIHPVLVNRPFVVTSKSTRLCRPSETVKSLIEELLCNDEISLVEMIEH